MVQKYLGLSHEYGKVDCIRLIKNFYNKELELDFPLPDYPLSKQWLKRYSTTFVDNWAASTFIKVNLTDAENYDVIAFKSNKTNLIIHFALFLKPVEMLHIEEGGFSCIQTLSQEWRDSIHSFYRHEQLVR
jgi:hypothetical protein